MPDAAARPRWRTDLETVGLALAPDTWVRLEAHLPPAPAPTRAPAGGADRASRLAALAQLVRASREEGSASGAPGSEVVLSRSDQRVLLWRPPHLALLLRAAPR
ncbi:MAG: hypothetical protein P1V51_20810 [Deltaproteobacteria bacterium]|nr:hypothetical protein [Deltaproteobacteria bacterium]